MRYIQFEELGGAAPPPMYHLFDGVYVWADVWDAVVLSRASVKKVKSTIRLVHLQFGESFMDLEQGEGGCLIDVVFGGVRVCAYVQARFFVVVRISFEPSDGPGAHIKTIKFIRLGSMGPSVFGGELGSCPKAFLRGRVPPPRAVHGERLQIEQQSLAKLDGMWRALWENDELQSVEMKSDKTSVREQRNSSELKQMKDRRIRDRDLFQEQLNKCVPISNKGPIVMRQLARRDLIIWNLLLGLNAARRVDNSREHPGKPEGYRFVRTVKRRDSVRMEREIKHTGGDFLDLMREVYCNQEAIYCAKCEGNEYRYE